MTSFLVLKKTKENLMLEKSPYKITGKLRIETRSVLHSCFRFTEDIIIIKVELPILNDFNLLQRQEVAISFPSINCYCKEHGHKYLRVAKL